MLKIAVLIADGSEELEALTPVDILRRAGVEVTTLSVGKKYITGSHNIIIKADKLAKRADFSAFDGIVIPGGMPGATNIAKCEKVVSAVREMLKNNKLVASICASPAVVLASNGLIDKRKVTCFPSQVFLDMLAPCEYIEQNVCVDGNLITANGPSSAVEFSLKICEYLGVSAKF